MQNIGRIAKTHKSEFPCFNNISLIWLDRVF